MQRPTPWRGALAVAALGVAATLAAAPYIPADEATVLERLPSRATAASREVASLRAAAARDPRDVGRAVAVADAYIRAARSEGDPRYLGYAQAALAPWWKDPDAPTLVLIRRATIRQNRHEFDPALADLDRALARNPLDAQALLTRATVLTVQGRYAPARRDCERLASAARGPYAIVCTGAIDGVSGNAAHAYDAVSRALGSAPRLDAGGRAWIETLLAEIAERRGDPAAAAHFRAALEADGSDLYTLGAYCDFLLDHGRAADVITLVPSDTRVDALLLRLALAQHALRLPEAAASIARLDARFEASRLRGDTVHQRENARFELELRGNARKALALAIDNWKVQKEPADLRILAEAAQAADDGYARGIVRQWIAETGIEYRAVRGRATTRGAAP